MGRKPIGKLRVYKMSQTDYDAFCAWVRSKGLIPSEVIRSLMIDYYIEGMIKDLDDKIKELKKNEV